MISFAPSITETIIIFLKIIGVIILWIAGAWLYTKRYKK